MKDENLFRTKDFYLATCILSSGYSLLRLERLSPKSMEFIFNICHDEADILLQQHWNRELKVPSRDLIDAIKELKTRLYSRSENAS